MRWIKLTRTNSGRYDGAMWVDADKLLGAQRVSNGRGTYTSLLTTVPDTFSDDHGNAPGGFAGLDVSETPEDIMSMLSDGASPEQPLSPASVRLA